MAPARGRFRVVFVPACRVPFHLLSTRRAEAACRARSIARRECVAQPRRTCQRVVPQAPCQHPGVLLARERAARTGAAGTRRALSGALRQARVARAVRPDVQREERPEDDRDDVARLLHAAAAGLQPRRGVRAPGAQRHRDAGAVGDGRPHRRDRRRALPAGHSAADARRERGPGRRPAGYAGNRPTHAASCASPSSSSLPFSSPYHGAIASAGCAAFRMSRLFSRNVEKNGMPRM